MNENDFKEKFEKFINSSILLDLKVTDDIKDTTANRMRILEKLIDLYRFHSADPETKISLNDVLSLDIDFIENGKIRIIGKKSQSGDKGFLRPHDLELPLLLFLLVYEEGGDVYSVITNFIDEIKPILKPLDFEKAKIGAPRCFTNTRFAAQTLRDYGLLKFTKEEAFRTWKLSFLGIAVASLIYHPDWLSDFKRTDYALYGHEYSKLPRTISTAINLICNRDEFVNRIRDVIRSSRVNTPFTPQALRDLHGLIGRYEDAVQNDYKSIVKNKTAINIIAEMEKRESIVNIMRDFKTAYEMKDFNKKINELIKDGFLPGSD